jgi:S-DNA-T family DNA segregation ATPase FtsK/SpoIIIE
VGSSKKQSLLDWAIDGLVKQFRNNDDELFFKVEEVISASRLENKDGLRPQLLKKDPGENGWHFVYTLPPGITLDDWEKRRKEFQTFTNATIEFRNNGPVLIMSVYQSAFPDEIPYSFDVAKFKKMIAPIPIGITPSGKLIIVDLAELPHMLVGGMTGYGKSVALRGISAALLLDGLNVSALDYKRVTFSKLSPWIRLAKEENDGERLLKRLIGIGEERLKFLDARGYEKVIELPKSIRPPLEVVIVDELTMINNKKSQGYIDDLVHVYRAAGISVILSTQRPSAQVWDSFTETRSMLSGRLCFYVADTTDSQIVLGKGDNRGNDLPMVKGRAIWKGEDEQDILLQTMFLSQDKAVELLHDVPKVVKEEDEPLPDFITPG